MPLLSALRPRARVQLPIDPRELSTDESVGKAYMAKDITVAWKGPGYSKKPQDISENYSASEHRLKALITQRRSKNVKALNKFLRACYPWPVKSYERIK